MLARQLAAARGISLEEAVKLALEESSKEIPHTVASNRLAKDELIRRLEEISARCGARPLVDPRSPDKLLGYDAFRHPWMIVIDSSALIAILEHEPERTAFFQAIASAESAASSAQSVIKRPAR